MSNKMQLIYSNAQSVSFAMKPRCKFETCDFSHSDQAVVTRHEENDCPARFIPRNQPLTYAQRLRRSAAKKGKGKGKASTSNNPPESATSNNPPDRSVDELVSFIDDPNQFATGHHPPERTPARKNRRGKRNGKAKAAVAAPAAVFEGQGSGLDGVVGDHLVGQGSVIDVGAGLEIQHPVGDLAIGQGVVNEPFGEDIRLDGDQCIAPPGFAFDSHTESSDDDLTPSGTGYGLGSRFSVLSETPASINQGLLTQQKKAASSVSCGSSTRTRAVGSGYFHSASKPFRQAAIPFSSSSQAGRVEFESSKPYRASQSSRSGFGGRFPASSRLPSLGASRPFGLTRVAAAPQPTAAASLHRASTPLPINDAATVAVPPPLSSQPIAAAAAAPPRTYRAALMAFPASRPLLPPQVHVLPGRPLLPGMVYLRQCGCSRGMPHLVAPPIPPRSKVRRPPP